MNQETKEETNPNKGNFLKAMIKINNPTWTPEQIEQELKRQMEKKDNDDDGAGCEACSG